MYFFPGTLSGQHEKTCVIPFGKAIFVPIVAGAADKSNANLLTDQDLVQRAKEGDDFSTRGVVLDGKKLNGFDGDARTEHYRVLLTLHTERTTFMIILWERLGHTLMVGTCNWNHCQKANMTSY